MRLLRLLLPPLFLAAACTTTDEPSTVDEAAEPIPLPAGERIGEAIEPQPIAPFAQLDADPTAYYERTVLVAATATAVCQKAGCWMQIEDEGRTAMVRWESGCGGKYAFPTDLAGKEIVIQGSFYPKVISEADAEHLQEEAGQDIEIEREGHEFNASAVLILD